MQNSVDRAHKNENLNIMFYFNYGTKENRQEHNSGQEFLIIHTEYYSYYLVC